MRQHRSRTARNPKVGTAVYVPAKKVPRFKTSADTTLQPSPQIHGHQEVALGLARPHGLNKGRETRRLKRHTKTPKQIAKRAP